LGNLTLKESVIALVDQQAGESETQRTLDIFHAMEDIFLWQSGSTNR